MTKVCPSRCMSISSAPSSQSTSSLPSAAAASMPATSRPPSAGTMPRSSPATREAAVCRMFKAIQPAALPCAASLAMRAARARIPLPSARATAAAPTMTSGCLAWRSTPEKACLPSATSRRVCGPAPR